MELNKIYNENCLETMSRMENDFIDLIVTSPPYDNLREYKGYEFDFESIAKELFRVTKIGGVVVWVVGDATIKGSETGTSFKQALYFKGIGFNLHDTMIYEKPQACFGSNKCYLQSFEYMFVFSKGNMKTINLIRDRKNVRNGIESMGNGGLTIDGKKQKRIRKNMKEYGKRKNIWKIGVGGKKDFEHPAIFPEQLANDHILSWSNALDIVYDPMAGSGTVPKMAKINNRQFIASELSKVYCGIINERINPDIQQGNLFYEKFK